MLKLDVWKTCKKCNLTQPLTEYYKKKWGWLGVCKDCCKEQVKATKLQK